MHIGITESQTRKILQREMGATGLEGGDTLILFGGIPCFVANRSKAEDDCRERCTSAWLRDRSSTGQGGLCLNRCRRVMGRIRFGYHPSRSFWPSKPLTTARVFLMIGQTFALPGSKIPKSHLEMWEIVRQAQSAPYHLLKASNTSQPPVLAELDIAARRVVTSFMPDSAHSGPEPDFSVFTHRLGHGIGLEVHENPFLVQGPLGQKKVQSGYVFSLEPGIYLPADGLKRNGLRGVGVRLEDCFVVTEDENGRLGGEWLSGPVKKWGDI